MGTGSAVRGEARETSTGTSTVDDSAPPELAAARCHVGDPAELAAERTSQANYGAGLSPVVAEEEL